MKAVRSLRFKITESYFFRKSSLPNSFAKQLPTFETAKIRYTTMTTHKLEAYDDPNLCIRMRFRNFHLYMYFKMHSLRR